MAARNVALNKVVQELDEFFSICELDRDPAMAHWLPRVYQDIGYDYTQILEPDFCARTNGLMLRSADRVGQVFCASFPCPEVVEGVLQRARGNALLYLHHPVDLEVSGAGFLPIPPESLERMRAQGISIYSNHAPLDCHDEIGTTASIVEALGVQVERSFAPYGNGFAGRIGTIKPVGLDELITRGKEVFCVERVEIGGAEPASIDRVAIVAGGGDEAELMEEAEGFGAQAYITGEWTTRTVPADESERRWADANRAACQAYAESSKMAMLGFSHAASEYLVMETQMAGFFEGMGLTVQCVAQSDWWR